MVYLLRLSSDVSTITNQFHISMYFSKTAYLVLC